jgi:hypothetical protein
MTAIVHGFRSLIVDDKMRRSNILFLGIRLQHGVHLTRHGRSVLMDLGIPTIGPKEIGMNRLFDLVTQQLDTFGQDIGPNHNVGVYLPGFAGHHFLPKLVDDYNPQIVIIDGELDSGDSPGSFSTAVPFPWCLWLF